MTRTKPRTARGTSRGRGRRKDHTVTDDTEMRDFTRQLFTESDYGDNWPTAGAGPAEPDKPKQGNHVPREGSTPPSKPTADEAYREWTRELFGHPGVEFV